jgi:hypothetical protein
VRLRLLLLAAVSAGSGVQSAHAHRTELKTELVVQQTPSWCWAATASMALKVLGFPDINPGKNYQCGVVAAAFPQCDDDCTKCDTELDTMPSFVRLLERYRDLSMRGKSLGLKASFHPNYVAYPGLRRIEHSIDLSFPVIAGISAGERPSDPAQPEHSVLITGYDDDHNGTGETWMIVRDPYPYASEENPWTNAGYPYRRPSGTALVPWRVLRGEMNLTSAVFLLKAAA